MSDPSCMIMSPRAAVMICDTLVNTNTHRDAQRQSAFDRLYYYLSRVSTIGGNSFNLSHDQVAVLYLIYIINLTVMLSNDLLFLKQVQPF